MFQLFKHCAAGQNVVQNVARADGICNILGWIWDWARRLRTDTSSPDAGNALMRTRPTHLTTLWLLIVSGLIRFTKSPEMPAA
jgi:hypothetical protein